MTAELISDTDALEACVGKRPAGSHLKSIAFLDEHCHTLLAASPFTVVGVVDADGNMRTSAIGGEPGVVAAVGDAAVTLPGSGAADGAAVGLLSFVPGYREPLRLNGRIQAGEPPTLELEEAFLHCAKALIRSQFWAEASPELGAELPSGSVELTDAAVAAFLEACPLVVLSSVDGDGHADVSPKGDPAGMVATVVDGTLMIADRPGNRRTDTMHNLVENDTIGLLAIIPGRDEVIEVRGRAGVTADEATRGRLEVNGKVPHAAIAITPDHVEIRTEPAIAAAALWDTSRHHDIATLPKSTQVWADHVKRNDDSGIGAKVARRVVTARRLEKGIDRDYRDNLY